MPQVNVRGLSMYYELAGAGTLDARGMRDGRIALSAAWQPAWPGW